LIPEEANGHVRPDDSANHSIVFQQEFPEKDISLLLYRACSTMDKIVDRCAITICFNSLGDILFNIPVVSSDILGF
jgi:hypothetical protein